MVFLLILKINLASYVIIVEQQHDQESEWQS